jgi:hypothetical protein
MLGNQKDDDNASATLEPLWLITSPAAIFIP